MGSPPPFIIPVTIDTVGVGGVAIIVVMVQEF